MSKSKRVDIRALAATQKLKPEFQGENHPLEKNQVKRKANPVGPSQRAIQALLQFYEESKCGDQKSKKKNSPEKIDETRVFPESREAGMRRREKNPVIWTDHYPNAPVEWIEKRNELIDEAEALGTTTYKLLVQRRNPYEIPDNE